MYAQFERINTKRGKQKWKNNNNYNVPAEFSPQTNGDLTAPAVAMSSAESAAIAMATQQKAIVEARYKMALARPRDLDLGAPENA